MERERAMERTLDRKRIEDLSFRLAQVVRDHYRTGQLGRDRVWEILNALAFNVGLILIGIDDDAGEADAAAFFATALAMARDDLRRGAKGSAPDAAR